MTAGRLPPPPIDLVEIRIIATLAGANERTVIKEVRDPGSVGRAVGDRIRRQLMKRGHRSAMPVAISHSPKLGA